MHDLCDARISDDTCLLLLPLNEEKGIIKYSATIKEGPLRTGEQKQLGTKGSNA